MASRIPILATFNALYAMLEFFGRLFGTDFMPHVYCLRDPALVALHAISDGLIAFAYLLIPVALLFLVRRRRDLLFPWMFSLFALFILGCGATHVLAIVTLWKPIYRFDGVIKAVTAMASMATAVLLFRLLPQLMHVPSPERLRKEIEERESVEREMRDMNRYLELRVIERTNELERTNQRLVESELRARRILDGANALVYVKDLQGCYTFVNKAFTKLAGLKREDILGRSDEDVFPLSLARTYRENDRRALKTGLLEVEEIAKVAGEEAVFFSSKFALRDFNGEPYATCGLSHDITDQRLADEALRRANDELRASEERLRQITELVPDMLWSANLDGSFRFISQSYVRYTGRTSEQFEKSGHINVFHPDDQPEMDRVFRHAVATGDPVEVEVRIRRHDGIYRWFISRTVPVWNDDFQVEYLIGAVTDIHQLKRTEQALRRSNEELEQFAYAAAHDLQEPLRNVSTSLGMLRRLVGDRLDTDESDWIDKSIRNAVRMQAMVKDLLLYSRAVSDENSTIPTVNSAAAAQQALANLAAVISEGGAVVDTFELPAVRAHEQHLVLLFQNLVGNSIKYRDPVRKPHITISASSNGSEWQFAVTDNGIGFDPAYSERIFKVFKRLHNREEYAGNGIGLAVCARIVAHYGGRIWAEGTPGEGATFRFTLPTHHK